MSERRIASRSKALRAGKILFNQRRSVIDCVIRNLSETGACVSVESLAGIPAEFELLIDAHQEPLKSIRMWDSENKMGVAFLTAIPSREEANDDVSQKPARTSVSEENGTPALVRGELLSLKAALDEVSFGVVLLDKELRAQFINRAFRRMWRLSDAKAESKPAFVALMYHGRDTRAYAISDEELDSYVAARVAHVKIGNAAPVDIRLTSGAVIRFQCAVLPAGGRMLSYTYVSDIVHHVDDLKLLKAGLDYVEHGVILLDCDLRAQFMNRSVRRLWQVTDEQADRKPHYAELVNDAHFTKAYGVTTEELDAYIAKRIAIVKAGDSTPMDISTSDGRVIRSQCAVLPGGGRMLSYHDVTDLVRQAEELEQLAITDGLTQVYNRRHIVALSKAEWVRLQRYDRPFSVLAIDVDRFKSVNDRFGHAAGDKALLHIATLLREALRSVDVIGRTGGDEFLVLLPETDLDRASAAADRVCELVRTRPLPWENTSVLLTVSVGIAQASLSMSSADEVLREADRALYLAKANGRNQSVGSGCFDGYQIGDDIRSA